MKVLLKILKKNVRNSIVCFMSTILTAIILFVFLGVKELVLGTMSMEERVRSQQGVAIQTYMYILLFIGLILISYTVSNYSRIRIKDYGMFMVFGEEKKDIIRMIILEYGIICGISWLIGCVVGTAFCNSSSVYIQKRRDSNSSRSMLVSKEYWKYMFLYVCYFVHCSNHEYNKNSKQFTGFAFEYGTEKGDGSVC